MGVTIHYSGKLEDSRALPDLLLAAKHFCFQHQWEYHQVDERIIGNVERWTTTTVKNEELSNDAMDWSDTTVETHTESIDDTLRGILVNPHPESETLWLTFNQHGELCFYLPQSDVGDYWENKLLFTKTQFAPIEVHIAICELLHLIQDRYMPSLSVSDEGEYFETGDRDRLAYKIGQLNTIMDQLEKKLSDENSDDPVVNAIRGAVDETNERKGKPKKNNKGKLSVERGKKISMRDPEWKRDHGTSANRN